MLDARSAVRLTRTTRGRKESVKSSHTSNSGVIINMYEVLVSPSNAVQWGLFSMSGM